jgi:enoyl-CoA hydratase
MTGEVVLVEKRGGVAVVTLNRPQVHNAIDPEMACRLVEVFDEFVTDASLLVAVVTGAGDKAFCSGGDLQTSLPLLTGERQPQNEFEARVVADPDILARAALRRTDIAKPVIAAVNGACLAGGMELLLNTDLRIAAEHVIFGLPEVRHGLVPFAGAFARLPQQVGYCAAMEILLTGTAIGAAEAKELRLVNRLVAAADVMPEALRLAERIAANGPLAVREAKQAVNAALGQPLAAAYRLEDAARQKVMASEDAREGPRAFREKRAARFLGR